MADSIKVFLSGTQNDKENLYREVYHTLMSAGMEVIQSPAALAGDVGYVQKVKEGIHEADCCVHILGSEHGEVLKLNDQISTNKFAFQEALKRIESGEQNFKMFIWHPPKVDWEEVEDGQRAFILEVRSSIVKNMIYTNTDSAIRFTDDIRSMMKPEQKQEYDLKAAEIFVIFNELDESEAEGVIDMLADIIDPIEKLNIIQDTDMDYSEYCVQQINLSKLVTIYFKSTAEWALPFTQQVWKKVGGASSPTPILLIGTEEPESNLNKGFAAPRVISMIIAGDLIPLEIKIQYDNVLAQA